MEEEKNQKEHKKKEVKYEILPSGYKGKSLSFKIIIIGDSGVGKSCLANRATTNIFLENSTTTIGIEFFDFHVKMFKKVIKLQIWDTCGQELFHSLIKNYYNNASLAIIVYAINSKQSFEHINDWLKEIRSNSSPNTKIFLIGNKSDLDEERVVTKEEGEKLAKDYNFELFLEASAKHGINHHKIFVEAAKLLYQDFLRFNSQNPENNEKTLKKTENSNKKGGCC